MNQTKRLHELLDRIETLMHSVQDELVAVAPPQADQPPEVVAGPMLIRSALYRAHARLSEARAAVQDAEGYTTFPHNLNHKGA